MEGCFKFYFLIDINSDYVVAENELAKNMLENVGNGQWLCNWEKIQF